MTCYNRVLRASAAPQDLQILHMDGREEIHLFVMKPGTPGNLSVTQLTPTETADLILVLYHALKRAHGDAAGLIRARLADYPQTLGPG